MSIAVVLRTSGRYCFAKLLLALSLYGCSSSGSRDGGGSGGGAIEAGNPEGGAPGLWDAAPTADAAGVTTGTSDAIVASADLGVVNPGFGSPDSALSPGDGLLSSVDGGLPAERAGGIPDDVASAREAGANDTPAPQVPDGAGDAREIDAAVTRDSAVDAPQADRGLVGDSGTAACVPDFPLWILRTLPEVQETYDVCDFPTGSARSDTTWTTDIRTTAVLSLVEAHTCVPDGDPQIRVPTGARFRIAVGMKPHSYNSQPPFRIYAIYEDQGAAQVVAGYDFNVTVGDAGTPPPFPEHYVSLDLVCGDPDAIPRFKGWTGRLGVFHTWVASISGLRTDMLAKYAFWGSAAGEQARDIAANTLDCLNHHVNGTDQPPLPASSRSTKWRNVQVGSTSDGVLKIYLPGSGAGGGDAGHRSAVASAHALLAVPQGSEVKRRLGPGGGGVWLGELRRSLAGLGASKDVSQGETWCCLVAVA